MGSRRCTRTAVVAGSVVLAELLLIRLGKTSGSTSSERRRRLPGDEIVAEPNVVTDHAISIEAPPECVWPWLVQMGWHRGGWYTARWVDRLLFPANWPSVDRIVPGLQDLRVGSLIPDGPPETGRGMVVERLEPQSALVLHSTSHLPASWRRRNLANLDWSWAFVLTPTADGGGTRFHFRSRWTTRPWWLTAGGWLAIVPADLVMSRGMLLGVKQRAESLHRSETESNDRASSSKPTRADLVRELRSVAADLPRFASAPLVRRWHQRWGATSAELREPMRGDELVADPHYQATRAITIDASPSTVWQWLVQVGCLRAGWYSDDLLDNLAHPSADAIDLRLQHLEIGQWVPMSPTPSERTAFKVAGFEPHRWMLWEQPVSTWTWRLTPLPGDRTRLVTRLRTRYDWHRPPDAILSLILNEFGDFAMMRRMLLGIKRRAEQAASDDLPEIRQGLMTHRPPITDSAGKCRADRRRRGWRCGQ